MGDGLDTPWDLTSIHDSAFLASCSRWERDTSAPRPRRADDRLVPLLARICSRVGAQRVLLLIGLPSAEAPLVVLDIEVGSSAMG